MYFKEGFVFIAFAFVFLARETHCCDSIMVSHCNRPIVGVRNHIAMNTNEDYVCRTKKAVSLCLGAIKEACWHNASRDLRISMLKAERRLSTIRCDPGPARHRCRSRDALNCAHIRKLSRYYNGVNDAECKFISSSKICFQDLTKVCKRRAIHRRIFRYMRTLNRESASVCKVREQDTTTEAPKIEANCTAAYITGCIQNNFTSMMDPPDTGSLCRFYKEEKVCLQPTVDNCDGDIKGRAEQFLKGTEDFRRMCDMKESDTGKCAMAEFQRCITAPPYLAIMSHSIPMCQIRKMENNCLQNISFNCDGNIKEQAEKVLKEAEHLTISCENEYPTLSSKKDVSKEENKSSCTLTEIQECESPDMFANIDLTDLKTTCRILKNLTSCFEKRIPHCSKQLQDWIEELLVNATVMNMNDMCKGYETEEENQPSCSLTEIQECASPEMFTKIDVTDLKTTCRILNNLTSCFEKLVPHCSKEHQNVIEGVFQNFEMVREMCKDVIEQENQPSCTLTEIQECASPEIISGIDLTDLKTTCRVAKNVTSCLQNLVSQCSGQFQDIIVEMLQQVGMVMQMCKGYETEQENQPSCTLTEIQECASPDMLAKIDLTDLETACQIAMNVSSCFQNLVPHCSKQFQNMIEKGLQQFDMIRQVCKGYWIKQENKPSCTFGEMMKCTSPDMFSGINPTDVNAMCRVVQNLTGCFQNIVPQCSGLFEDIIEEMLQPVGIVIKVCKEYEIEQENETTCSLKEVSQCSQHYNVTDPIDSNDLCRSMNMAAMCLEKQVTNCDGEIQHKAQAILVHTNTIRYHCNDNGSVQEDKTSCTTEDLRTCVSPNTYNLTYTTDFFSMCRLMNKSTNCLKNLVTTCSGTIQHIARASLKNMDKNLLNCSRDDKQENKVSCTIEEMSKCTTPITIGGMDTTDIEAMCRKLNTMANCLEKLHECNPDMQEMVQSMLRQKDQLSVCSRYEDKQENKNTCTMEEFQKCGTSNMDNQTNITDMDAKCRLINKTSTCLQHFVTNCTGTIQQVARSAIDIFNQETKTDRLKCSGNGNQKEFKATTICTSEELIKCVPIELQKIGAKVDHMCGVVLKTLICVENFAINCSGQVQRMAQTILSNTKMARQACENKNTCTMEEFQKCGISNMDIETNITDMDAKCRLINTTSTCLQNFVTNCTGTIQQVARSSLDIFNRETKTDRLKCSGNGNQNENKVSCTMEELSKCTTPITAGGLDTTDIEAMCRQLNTMANCLDKLHECNPQMQELVQAMLRQKDQLLVCSRYEDKQENKATTICTSEELIKCVPIELQMIGEKVDHMCGVVRKSVICIENFATNCSGRVQQLAQNILSNTKMARQACDDKNTKCAMTELQKCITPSDSDNATDLSSICRLMNETTFCLQNLITDCSGEIQKQAESALTTTLDMIQNTCSQNTSCSSDDISSCTKNIDNKPSLTDKDHICSDTLEATNCLEILEKQCSSSTIMKEVKRLLILLNRIIYLC